MYNLYKIRPLHLSALLVILCCVPVKSFCPSGCHCDDVKLSVYCVSAKLDIVPILLNPGTTGLDLSYNIIRNINPGFAFYRSLITLNLSNNIIESLGSSNFASQNNLQQLILNNNRISKIKSHSFAGLLNLSYLDLSQNYIQNIENNSFRSLQSLHTLDLSFNVLESLESDIFSNPNSLVILNLCNNSIKNITEEMFSIMLYLKELHLCSNGIVTIENGAFLNQSRLQLLILGQNKIHRISENSFLGLKSLLTIDLQSNLLENIPTNQMRYLSKVEKIILGNNFFEVVPQNAFQELHNLKSLQLSKNQKLHSIQQNAFHNLKKLQILELSYNHKLEKLSMNAFSDLVNLKHLILRGNHILTLGETMINPSALLTLDLRENQLECNCSLNWLNKLLKNHNSSLQIKDIKCSSPEKLRTRRIIDLNEYDLKCYSHVLFIISTASAIVVLLLLVVISGYFYMTKCKRMKSIVQDTWPEKIVTTWNGNKLDKQLQEEEYTFQTRQTIKTRPPVLWHDVTTTRDDFSSDAYASTTAASTPQEEYNDYRNPVFTSTTANKIKNKFYSANPNKYRSITRSYTDSSSSIKDFANSSSGDVSHSIISRSDRSRQDSSSIVCSSSPYEQQIFSIAIGANQLSSFQIEKETPYQSWRCFDPKFSHSADILDKERPILSNPKTSSQKSRTLRQNGISGKIVSSSNDRILTLSHLYALPKHPNFGYENDNIYDNIM